MRPRNCLASMVGFCYTSLGFSYLPNLPFKKAQEASKPAFGGMICHQDTMTLSGGRVQESQSL